VLHSARSYPRAVALSTIVVPQRSIKSANRFLDFELFVLLCGREL
jgi:hypothetical protein